MRGKSDPAARKPRPNGTMLSKLIDPNPDYILYIMKKVLDKLKSICYNVYITRKGERANGRSRN